MERRFEELESLLFRDGEEPLHFSVTLAPGAQPDPEGLLDGVIDAVKFMRDDSVPECVPTCKGPKGTLNELLGL